MEQIATSIIIIGFAVMVVVVAIGFVICLINYIVNSVLDAKIKRDTMLYRRRTYHL